MTGTPATLELSTMIRRMFEAYPEQTVQILCTPRLTVGGSRVKGTKTYGLYHQADGEVGFNTSNLKPVDRALRQVLKGLGFDTKSCNAALLAVREPEGVTLRVVAIAQGNLETGETMLLDATTDEDAMRGASVEWYRVAKPVGTIVEIAADGATTREDGTAAGQDWGFSPIPWGDRTVDEHLKTQIRETVNFEIPTMPTTRRIGVPATKP